MTESRGEIPVTRDCGLMRTSHADREQAVGVLKAAFVQGMLTKDEFDLRIGQVLASRMYGELAALTADIPAGVTAARPLSKPARGAAGKRTAKVFVSVTATFMGMGAMAATAGGGITVERLALVAWLVPFAAMLVAALLALHAWLERHPGGQSSPGQPPGTGGGAGGPAGGDGPRSGRTGAARGPRDRLLADGGAISGGTGAHIAQVA